MKPLVLIPARGGSKGVPKKNIKQLCGKPLINYTIDSALEIFDSKVICVSTDDEEIKDTVENTTKLKVPFLRPHELSTDEAGTYEVILHAIDYYKNNGYDPDTLILLQPTSPLRTAQHIVQAMALYSSDLDMVVSVKETHSNPYYSLFEEKNGFLTLSKEGNFTRRQDCPPVWEFNGAIYIINVDSLRKGWFSSFNKIKKYQMSVNESFDIDTMLDWKICEIILSIPQ